VNWRPADNETVQINPPRFSWPYRADWRRNWGSDSHTFRLWISMHADVNARKRGWRIRPTDVSSGREAQDFVYMAVDPTRCYPAEPGNYSRMALT